MTSVWCAQTLSWVGVIDPTHHEKHHHLYSTIPPSASKICASYPSANSDHIMYKVSYILVTSRILLQVTTCIAPAIPCGLHEVRYIWYEEDISLFFTVRVGHFYIGVLLPFSGSPFSLENFWFGDAPSATRAKTLNPSASNRLTASHTRGKGVLPEITEHGKAA